MGENHPSYGVERTHEWRDNISKGNKGKLKNKTWDEIMGSALATKRRLENAESMARTNEKLLNDRTSISEKRIATIFSTLQRNKKIGRYIVDLVDEQDKLIIEYNGGYWHADPRNYQPNDFISQIGVTAQQKWDYDAKRLMYLHNLGYLVVTLWSSDVDNLSDDEIKTFVENIKKNSPK
jgi:very-short-patch-repair endonuclease